METVIPAALVAPVLAYLKGSRLAKLQESLAALRAAEARGAWDGREARKASVGFNQGLAKLCTVKFPADLEGVESKISYDANGEMLFYRGYRKQAEFCIEYGYPYEGPTPRVIVGKGRACKEISAKVVESWARLCTVAATLRKQLDTARPKPVITAIGLSPKVTKTLTEMNLDIDLPTIAPAEIESYQRQSRDEKTGELLFSDGVPVMEIDYRVKWAPGTKLGLSRFAYGCQACGKPIPSGRYVPIQAECKRNGLLGLWIGCDCARNIFGVKDLGIAKE